MKSIDPRKYAYYFGWLLFIPGAIVLISIMVFSLQMDKNIFYGGFLFNAFLIGLILFIAGGIQWGIADIIKEIRKK